MKAFVFAAASILQLGVNVMPNNNWRFTPEAGRGRAAAAGVLKDAAFLAGSSQVRF